MAHMPGGSLRLAGRVWEAQGLLFGRHDTLSRRWLNLLPSASGDDRVGTLDEPMGDRPAPFLGGAYAQ